MEWTARFRDRNSGDVLGPDGVRFRVVRVSWAAMGGPERAEIAAEGDELALWRLLGWLRYGVEIDNPLAECEWWGTVYEVEVSVGGLVVGVSLEEMANSVAVAYTTEDGERGTTGYAVDSMSVETYGTKQLLVSGSNLTQAAAEQRRARELAQRRYPAAVPNPGGGGDGLRVTLVCRGWWVTLGWPYFSRDEGLEMHAGSSEKAQTLGLGFSSGKMGFEAGFRYVSDINGNLTELKKGDRFRVAGSGSNNGVYTVEQGTLGEPVSYGVATISFDAASREVRDSANGLKDFSAHDVIQIAGSASNNGYRRVESAAFDGSKVVVVGTLVDEGAGASVTLSRGHRIQVEDAVVDELPGATVTVTALGAQVAGSFQVGSGEAWTAAAAGVKARVVGSPVDSLQVAIYSDSSGSPGTLLDSATLAADNMASDSEWVRVALANTLSLAPGTTYWLVVSRTGSASATDFYEVMVDEDLGYAGGSLKVHDGSGWVARPVDADLHFRITGLEATDVQIMEIIATAGEFVGGADVVDVSGVETNQYRDGDGRALAELEALLVLGTTNDRRLLGTVLRNGTVRIEEEPAEPEMASFYLLSDGTLANVFGERLAPGRAVVGQWVDLQGVIPATAALSRLVRPAPFLVERAEYDVERGRLRLEPRAARSVWADATVREG